MTSDPWSFSIGVYDLSEIGPAGYSHGDWVCVGTGTQDDGDTVRLGLGESLACTLTNDGVPPRKAHADQAGRQRQRRHGAREPLYTDGDGTDFIQRFRSSGVERLWLPKWHL